MSLREYIFCTPLPYHLTRSLTPLLTSLSFPLSILQHPFPIRICRISEPSPFILLVLCFSFQFCIPRRIRASLYYWDQNVFGSMSCRWSDRTWELAALSRIRGSSDMKGLNSNHLHSSDSSVILNGFSIWVLHPLPFNLLPLSAHLAPCPAFLATLSS